MSDLSELERLSDNLKIQNRRMPVLFTSHGNPMDIPLSRDQRPFWKALYELGKQLQENYEVKAAVVVSAHWCTRGTFVNTELNQKQIYDYYGFPDEYYKVTYEANGSPVVARQIHEMVPDIVETSDWGLDHGAWPMLMHLFPKGDVPVFQLSIDYYAAPDYHFKLGELLKSLRDKGVLIIGSGSLIHNLRLASQKMMRNDFSPYGWEEEYDQWIKQQIDQRNFQNIIRYEDSHPLGKLAAPTPDHYVPVLYSLGLSDTSDEIKYFFEAPTSLPAFSERSFLIADSKSVMV